MAASWETIPPTNHQNVTKSDATVYDPPFRALVIGGGGTLVVTSKDGADATYTVQAGQTIVIVGTKVKAATTATGIVAQF